MGRALRAAAGGLVYHVLNRANGRLPLFDKDGDYEAFANRSRVERWRGGLGQAQRLPALSSAGASLAWPCPVSTSRSSNRTCGFPATEKGDAVDRKRGRRRLRLSLAGVGPFPDTLCFRL